MNNYAKAILVIATAMALSACVARRAAAVREGAQQMFNAADTNGDGVITKAEFLDSRAAIFDRADMNRDGALSKEELAALRGSLRGGR